jgi:tripartite-type tricarboxylate transporter receptor subunit TctC
VLDTVAGRMDFLFSSYLSAAGHIESGELRMLAIAGSQRHPRIAEVPTMAEAGYPDVEMQQWFGLFAPANTPMPVVRKLNAEFVKALQSDEVKDKVLPQVAFVIPGTPEDLAAMVARDMARLGEVVRESGATAPD